MRRFSFLLLLALAIGAAEARDIVLVALNPETPAIALRREDIADIFLGRQRILSGGLSLVPIDTSDEALRESFYQGVAGMSSNRVRAYWARLVFSSQGRPPRELASDAAIQTLLHDPGTVIYTFDDRMPAQGKILLRIER